MTGTRVRMVVGFDGSPNSVSAADWALGEARLRDRVVVLCHVSPGRRGSGGTHDEERAAARRVLDSGIRYASERAPTVEVVPELRFGDPARQLLSAASGAALVVVGARGEGGFPGLRLGSVSAQIARHAPGTVVVVPDRARRADKEGDRQVVVGVDGSAGSRAALAFGLTEAAGRQAELRAVHVFDARTLEIMAGLPQADLRRLHVDAADTLRRLVVTAAARHPDVRICCEVLSGAPATTLTTAAEGAELLVLGSRGHGDVATLLLGSTSHTVLHNATCPVAVVRDDRANPPGGRRRRRRGSLVAGRS